MPSSLMVQPIVDATSCARKYLAARRSAEGAGFEPAVRVNGLWFSRPAHSTALPPLRELQAYELSRAGSLRLGDGELGGRDVLDHVAHRLVDRDLIGAAAAAADAEQDLAELGCRRGVDAGELRA